MNHERLSAIMGRYAGLRIAIAGDFFLDRYLHIDPAKGETSIETGLPVHNVVEVRAQPGAAGTILNNLVALGVGEIHPIGFCGDDGEGYELRRALESKPGVSLEHFAVAPSRRTPVYCKPLVIEPGRPPRELSRFDSKNWSPTPEPVQRDLIASIRALAPRVDAILLMDQVDLPETGAATRAACEAVRGALAEKSSLVVLADSRRGFRDFPPLPFKMNADELARTIGGTAGGSGEVAEQAAALADRNGHPVFVTMSERGIISAFPGRKAESVPAHPVRGPIDIVGAGDAVSANLAAALAAGASPREAMTLAMAASSLVIHQLGTTGTASPAQIAELLGLG